MTSLVNDTIHMSALLIMPLRRRPKRKKKKKQKQKPKKPRKGRLPRVKALMVTSVTLRI